MPEVTELFGVSPGISAVLLFELECYPYTITAFQWCSLLLS